MGIARETWQAVVVLVLGIAGCNPFDAFAECDYGSSSLDLSRGDVKIDVEAAAGAFEGEHTGVLTWLRTEATSDLKVVIARDEPRAITRDNDCDGKLQGFEVPMKISASSGDGLISAPEVGFTLLLDTSGNFDSTTLESYGAAVDFDALKAAGVTPPDWVSNFFPQLSLPIRAPDLAPLDGAVLNEDSLRRTVVLGRVDFP